MRLYLKIVMLVFVFALRLHAVEQPDAWTLAFAAHDAGKYRESWRLLEAMEQEQGREQDKYIYLRLKLATQLGLEDRVKYYIKKSEERLSKKTAWSGAMSCILGDIYSAQQDAHKASKYYNNALAYGGQYVDDAYVLLQLATLSVDANEQRALRYARLIWHGNYKPVFRVQAGLIYAYLLKSNNLSEARSVLTELRLMSSCTDEQYFQASEMLVSLLLPKHHDDAVRVVELILKSNKYQDDKLKRLQAWHVLCLLKVDAVRAEKMITAYGIDDHELLKYVKRNERDANQVDSLLMNIEQCVKQGDFDQARLLIKDLYLHDERLFALAIKSGFTLKELLQAPIARRSHLGLLLLERFALSQRDECAAFFLPLVRDLLKTDELRAADNSLLLYCVHEKFYSDAISGEIVQKLVTYSDRHAPMGLFFAQQAQRQQLDDPQASLHSWKLCLRYLPLDHPWFASAAERVSLAVLLPVAPGETPQDIDINTLKEINHVIDSLAQVAWLGSEEHHLRCRYLLAQALSQVGKLGEARLCFESLHPKADNRRKLKIDKALQQINETLSHNINDKVN